jgi:hypothetical protein
MMLGMGPLFYFLYDFFHHGLRMNGWKEGSKSAAGADWTSFLCRTLFPFSHDEMREGGKKRLERRCMD